ISLHKHPHAGAFIVLSRIPRSEMSKKRWGLDARGDFLLGHGTKKKKAKGHHIRALLYITCAYFTSRLHNTSIYNK
ncbi:MAG TPA: hypothetical protein PLA01_00080, partial [Acetivibrio sp.]|nr:hypothetical protein [Acetivibrio sp.]